MKPCKRGHTEGRHKDGMCRCCAREAARKSARRSTTRKGLLSLMSLDDSIESRPVVADVCCEDLMLLTEHGGMQ